MTPVTFDLEHCELQTNQAGLLRVFPWNTSYF